MRVLSRYMRYNFIHLFILIMDFVLYICFMSTTNWTFFYMLSLIVNKAFNRSTELPGEG